MMLWSRQENVNTSITTLHFFYSFGGFVAPLIVALFIQLTGSAMNIYMLLPLLMLVPLPYLVLSSSPPTRTKPDEIDVAAANPWAYVIVVPLLMAVYVGVETSIGGWVYTYVVNTNVTNETYAAYLTAVGW